MNISTSSRAEPPLSRSQTNLAPDYYTPPSDDLNLFRETANRLGTSYMVGLKDEVLLSGTPTEIRAETKRIIKGLYPCTGGCVIVPNMVPMGTPAENILQDARRRTSCGTAGSTARSGLASWG